MDSKDKYVTMAFQMFDDAIKLLKRGDVLDAVEKAWCAVESARKAFLIAIGVPESKAGSVEFGVTFFAKVLRSLNRKDLVDRYYNFDYCLHIKGFYESQIPFEVIEEKIYEVKNWMDEIFKLIDRIQKIDFSSAIKLMDEILKLKRKILQMDMEYRKMLQQVDVELVQALTKQKFMH